MPLDLSKIEAFFQTKFDTSQPLLILAHFDGYAHWTVLFAQESPHLPLKIMADKDLGGRGYPTVEIEVWCTGIHHGNDNSFGGEFLALRPRGAVSIENLIFLCRTTKGRLSLSTRVGRPPEPEIFKIPSHWFEEED